MAGISDQGFTTKRMTEILSDLRAEAVKGFQDQVSPGDVVDVSDSSALGRLISLVCPSLSELWEAAQQDYAAFDPNSATGIALDNLVALGGLTRQEQTYTTATILVGGTQGTVISVGQTVGTSTNNNYFTTTTPILLSASNSSGVTLSVNSVQNNTVYSFTYTGNSTSNTVSFTSDNSATLAEILEGLRLVVVSAHPSLNATVINQRLVVNKNDVFQTVAFTSSNNLSIVSVRSVGEVVSAVAGPIKQEAGTINRIVTPILGWDSVTNPSAANSGRNLETDSELRLRFRNGKYEKATSIFEALYSSISNLEGVTEVVIYENDTSMVDANGVPAHSFLPIVSGGLSTDIANSIWQNKPIGILSYGNTSVTVNDVNGFSHAVMFSRPTPLVVYITIDITTDPSFPANGNDAIRSALIAYFEQNFGIGDDIIYSRLYTPINSVPGHQVESLKIGTSLNPSGTGNIVVPFSSIASLSSINISIV